MAKRSLNRESIPELVTVRDIAAMAKVSLRTAWRLVKRWELKRINGLRTKFDKADVLARMRSKG